MNSTSSATSSAAAPLSSRVPALRRVRRWWRAHVSSAVDHEGVMARVAEDSGWSARFAFMTIMSAGIAVLGLLQSSPAVVIGAMLISPLMGPIMGLGFSLALFDFTEMRRSIVALAVASALAIGFTALVVLLSPLKATTAEILARTRPNLFDLLVAMFSALAGTFALIRGRGETIVGVAIATALMPPLATVGYGLAVGNFAIAGGAAALFGTNFVTITLSAMIMAQLYGFGHRLSEQQTWAQTGLLVGAFLVMAIPLGISLNQIAREAVIATQVRSVLNTSYGKDARVAQLDIDYKVNPIAIRAVVIAPRSNALRPQILAQAIEAKLGQPVSLQADQVLVDPGSAAIDQEQAAFTQAQEQQRLREEGSEIVRLLAITAGAKPSDVLLDRDARRAVTAAQPLPGASLLAYRLLETRVASQINGWSIAIVPPAGLDLPPIAFASGSDQLDDAGKTALSTAIWATRRWNWTALSVPGLREPVSERATLDQRRAAAIAAALRENKIVAVPTRPGRAGAAIELGAARADTSTQ
nr:DUF389 domain-containing protein [Sphingomonas lycopersici]